MACPKGWEALTPLRAPDRATTPLLRDARRQARSRSTGTTALRDVRRRASRRSRREHGPDVGRLPQHRPDRHRGDGAARRARQVRHGHGPRRRQHPPVHGHRGRRLQAVVRLRRAAVHLRGLRGVRRHRAGRLEPLHRPPDHVGARLPQPARARDHRRRSAQDRDRDGGHRSTSRSGRSRDLALLYGLAQLLIERRLDRPRRSSTRTPPASTTFAAHVARVHARARRAADRPRRRRSSRRSPTPSTRGKRVSFWWTMGVNQSHEGVRTAQAIINLALMTGNIGRPGTGANSITGQCNAMGSRLFSNTTNLLGGHDFTNAEHRAQGRRASSASTRRASPTRAEPGLRPDHRGHPARARSGACGSSPPTRPTRGSTRTTCTTCSAGSTSWSCRTCTPPPRPPQLADLRPAGRRLGREGGHVHQLRAPHRPDQEGRARARARRWPTSTSSSWSPRPGAAATCSREWTTPEAVFQILKRLSRGPPCDITGIADYAMLDARGRHPVAVPRGRAATLASHERRLFADGRFFHARRQGAASCSTTPRPLPEPTSDELPAPAAHRPRQLQPVAHADPHRQVGGAAPAGTRARSTSRSAPPTPRALGIATERLGRSSASRARADAGARLRHPRRCAPGQVFIPMHYAEINQLTFAAFDPYSRQPPTRPARWSCGGRPRSESATPGSELRQREDHRRAPKSRRGTMLWVGEDQSTLDGLVGRQLGLGSRRRSTSQTTPGWAGRRLRPSPGHSDRS